MDEPCICGHKRSEHARWHEHWCGSCECGAYTPEQLNPPRHEVEQ